MDFVDDNEILVVENNIASQHFKYPRIAIWNQIQLIDLEDF